MHGREQGQHADLWLVSGSIGMKYYMFGPNTDTDITRRRAVSRLQANTKVSTWGFTCIDDAA